MAVVIVGGQMRGVGKTSVVCGLIAALPELHWTAVKVSTHGHSAAVEVYEEKTGTGNEKDSARYYAAGAVRSFYISAPEGGLWRAMPRLLEILAESRNAMVESTSVMAYLRPELSLAVISPAAGEMKASLKLWGDRFDAVVAPDGVALPEIFQRKKLIGLIPPVYASPELVKFVRTRILI